VNAHDRVNVLLSDVEIKGSLRTEKDLIFNGKLEGEIVAGGKVTLDSSADIHGDVKARSLNLFGKVRGNVSVADICIISSSGVLIGGLKAIRLVLEENASFVGQSCVAPMPLAASVGGNDRELPDDGKEHSVSTLDESRTP
jgi:cytoskeletal protein CcmA (bactofilin family)